VREADVRGVDDEFLWWEPGLGEVADVPYSVTVAEGAGLRKWAVVKIEYVAGYRRREVPEDLAAALVELTAWNYGRYKDKRVGIVGVKKGDTLTYESGMPERVKEMLEPFRRKTW
jgi:hypothetical protein